jgi:FkbM family methyltransferase
MDPGALAYAGAQGGRQAGRPVKTLRGIARSLAAYHGRMHMHAMVAFYRRILKPGGLVFDVGAHAGDRTRAFLRLDCRVVAVEPQPALARLLKLRYAFNRKAVILAAALSDGAPMVNLRVNKANPTVSTASADFVHAAAAGAPGWHNQVWDYEIEVPALTLDRLIALYGRPAFTKIDVEGFEDRVLAGLSEPLPALSFEFTTLQRQVAFRALERLRSLGDYRFNACFGESWQSVFAAPQTSETIAAWLEALPFEVNSGDIYCFLGPQPQD